VGGVEALVGEAVEGHRRTAGEHHAQKHSAKLQKRKRPLGLPGQGGARQGEGEGEDRVAEADHFQQRAHTAQHGQLLVTGSRGSTWPLVSGGGPVTSTVFSAAAASSRAR